MPLGDPLADRFHAPKGSAHARRGIRSGSKLIEGLDMAQTPQP